MKNTNNVEININKEKDDVIIGEDSINIITENGIKVELPYEKAVIETDDKQISFKKDGDSYKIKRKKI